MQNPNYLKAMLREGILYKKNIELSLESYTNGDYVESIVDQSSLIGYCTFLRGNLVMLWRKKFNVVAISSGKVEHRVMGKRNCKLFYPKIIF